MATKKAEVSLSSAPKKVDKHVSNESSSEAGNTDDLQYVVVDTPKFEPNQLTSNYPFIGDILLEKGSELIADIRDLLEGTDMKPEVPSLKRLFKKALGGEEQKNYIPIINRMKTHTPGSLDTLLKAKFAFENSAHKLQKEFLLNSIKAGNGIETGLIDWNFSKESYGEAKARAISKLEEAVYAANWKDKISLEKESLNLETVIGNHLDYFTFSVKVAKAIDDFEGDIKKANEDIAQAYSNLVSSLYKNWSLASKGESVRFSTEQKDSSTLWTAIQSTYKK